MGRGMYCMLGYLAYYGVAVTYEWLLTKASVQCHTGLVPHCRRLLHIKLMLTCDMTCGMHSFKARDGACLTCLSSLCAVIHVPISGR